MKPYSPPPRFTKQSAHDGDHGGRQNWELTICGDLTEKQDGLFERFTEVPLRSKGTIYFDSSGGSAYVGLALATIIRLRGLDAAAVVLGECSSAALLPFAACSRRFVTSHSTLLFHPIRWQSEENVNLDEAAEWTRHFRVMEQDLDTLLARMFEISAEKLAEWTKPGRFLTGTDISEAGLATLVDLHSGDLQSQIAAARI